MPVVHDVIVIGAGLAGLTTAHKLQCAGRDVIVLEAKDRVGGRLLTQHHGNTALDAGGSWVAPHHTSLLALLAELQIKTWPQHLTGKNILLWNDTRTTFRGETPSFPRYSLLEMAWVQMRLNMMARKVVGSQPWRHPLAATYDSLTVGDWIDSHVHTQATKFMLELVTASSFGCTPQELSLYGFLVHVASAGSIQTLVGDNGAALDRHITGGSAGVCKALAMLLDGHVHLNAPAICIDRTRQPIVVTTPQGEFNAQDIVIAVDPATARNISHVPALSKERSILETRYRMGSGIKAHIVYETPFWRHDGLSGQSISNTGLAQLTFDVTPPDATTGVLMCFVGGTAVDNEALLEPGAVEARKRRLLSELAQRFGSAATSALEYLEHDWTLEPFQSGCVPMPPVGVLTGAKGVLTQSTEHIHYAGAETSHIWEGHMEGAVRSAERVAAEISVR
jgi:monoamine oxidase